MGGFGKVLVWFWGAVEIDFRWEFSHVRKTRVAAERASKRVAVGNVQKARLSFLQNSHGSLTCKRLAQAFFIIRTGSLLVVAHCSRSRAKGSLKPSSNLYMVLYLLVKRSR